MLRGKKTTKAGQQLILGDNAPPCQLVDIDFKVLSLNDFNKIPKLIYTYPTIETDKCFNNLKRLKAFTQIFKNHQFIAVSVDLPFTLKRVSTAYGLNDIMCLSDFRTREFGLTYGVLILDGLLAGMLADSVILLDSDNKVSYIQSLQQLENDLDWQEIKSALEQDHRGLKA